MHFGHRTEHWHPKMEEYIFGKRNKVHIIDIEQTEKALENLATYVKNTVARGGTVLFVSTKLQIQPIVKEYAIAGGMPFVTERWIGGTFTNFAEIKKLIVTYLDLKDKREKGELKKYTKLEQLQLDRKIEELDHKIGGISQLKKLPDAVIVFDVRNDKTAVTEATKQGIKTIGICDTNVNPDLVDVVIPANDDSIASIEMIAKIASEAAKEGKKEAATIAAQNAEKQKKALEAKKAAASVKAPEKKEVSEKKEAPEKKEDSKESK